MENIKNIIAILNKIDTTKDDQKRQIKFARAIIGVLNKFIPLPVYYKQGETKAQLIKVEWLGTTTKKTKKNGYFQFIFAFNDEYYNQQSLAQLWRQSSENTVSIKSKDKPIINPNGKSNSKTNSKAKDKSMAIKRDKPKKLVQASSAWKDLSINGVCLNDILPLEVRRLDNIIALKAWFISKFLIDIKTESKDIKITDTKDDTKQDAKQTKEIIKTQNDLDSIVEVKLERKSSADHFNDFLQTQMNIISNDIINTDMKIIPTEVPTEMPKEVQMEIPPVTKTEKLDLTQMQVQTQEPMEIQSGQYIQNQSVTELPTIDVDALIENGLTGEQLFNMLSS